MNSCIIRFRVQLRQQDLISGDGNKPLQLKRGQGAASPAVRGLCNGIRALWPHGVNVHFYFFMPTHNTFYSCFYFM